MTLGAMAEKLGTSVSHLLEMNPEITDANSIQVDMAVKIHEGTAKFSAADCAADKVCIDAALPPIPPLMSPAPPSARPPPLASPFPTPCSGPCPGQQQLSQR